MAKINASVRRCKEQGKAHLFFYNDDGKCYWLECYTQAEQHGTASLAFMRDECVPASWDDADVKSLVEEWNGQPPRDLEIHLVTRLPRPRNRRYHGH